MSTLVIEIDLPDDVVASIQNGPGSLHKRVFEALAQEEPELVRFIRRRTHWEKTEDNERQNMKSKQTGMSIDPLAVVPETKTAPVQAGHTPSPWKFGGAS